MYLVWSNQHSMWWRPNERGYTGLIEEAGRYERDHAERIVANAGCDGLLTYPRTNPITGEAYLAVPEVMVLAPEATP